MSRSLALVALAAVFAVGFAPTAAPADDAKDFFFKPNDRIVFLGDSITIL
jgi:hypothetical protein